MTTTNTTLQPAMALALSASFGHVEGWHDAFSALMRSGADGREQAVLSFHPRTGALVNRLVRRNAPAASDSVTLLGVDLPSAVDLESLDWAPVYERYQAAVHDATEAFGAEPQDAASALLIDVRRAGVFDQSAVMLPGAHWRDPGQVSAWAGDLPTGREVLVYCVYGHEVGRVTALRLRAAGLNARYLRGGIDGWQAAGLPLVKKELAS